jgi:L-amino acid N-acyltransferase YncA
VDKSASKALAKRAGTYHCAHDDYVFNDMLIRPAIDNDIQAIQTIYAYWVANGTASFELEAPDASEIVKRRADVLSKGLPYLVAEDSGCVVGYAYANWFRPRPAYRFCVENSIYVDASVRRSGVARLLMSELISRCEQAGARQMIAVIGDSANVPSIKFHASIGFEHVGVIRSTGWKFNRWLDTVLMQRTLGSGDQTPATPI